MIVDINQNMYFPGLMLEQTLEMSKHIVRKENQCENQFHPYVGLTTSQISYACVKPKWKICVQLIEDSAWTADYQIDWN